MLKLSLIKIIMYASVVSGYLTEFGYEEKRKKIIAELQHEEKEKKLSVSAKDLGDVSVHEELSKLFKSPSTPITFIPTANPMSSRSTAKKKSLKLKKTGASNDESPLTIFNIPQSTTTLPKEKEKQSLRRMGKMKYVYIYNEDTQLNVYEKIFQCFPEVKKFVIVTCTATGDLFDCEQPPHGFESWCGEAVRNVIKITAGSLLIRDLSTTSTTSTANTSSSTTTHNTITVSSNPSMTDVTKTGISSAHFFSLSGAPNVVGQIINMTNPPRQQQQNKGVCMKEFSITLHL